MVVVPGLPVVSQMDVRTAPGVITVSVIGAVVGVLVVIVVLVLELDGAPVSNPVALPVVVGVFACCVLDVVARVDVLRVSGVVGLT